MTPPLDATIHHASDAAAIDLRARGSSSPDITSQGGRHSTRATFALRLAATCWFVVAGLGQLMFVAYLLGFYGHTTVRGHFEAWNQVFPRAYVAGDALHNTMVALHLIFAALITVGGWLQLMTGVRRRFPRFHRWNGRIYLASALVMAMGGLAMVWTGTAVGDLPQHIAISLNALLIMLCALMALRHAQARRLVQHQRWALRLFLVVSGVWFFRIGLALWIMLNQGPAGFDPDTFTGPALTLIAFGQYLLPLAVLHLYFRARDGGGPRRLVAAIAALSASTLLTGVGVAAASMMLWLPHL